MYAWPVLPNAVGVGESLCVTSSVAQQVTARCNTGKTRV